MPCQREATSGPEKWREGKVIIRYSLWNYLCSVVGQARMKQQKWQRRRWGEGGEKGKNGSSAYLTFRLSKKNTAHMSRKLTNRDLLLPTLMVYPRVLAVVFATARTVVSDGPSPLPFLFAFSTSARIRLGVVISGIPSGSEPWAMYFTLVSDPSRYASSSKGAENKHGRCLARNVRLPT